MSAKNAFMKIEERRLLTILFADLSGFTALSSKLDPEEVQEVASTCFEHLNQPIVKHGGTIHKYEGDLVIALFGYPSAHEDDPERAIQAALEMMALVPEVNRALAGKLNRPTSLGLHAGVNMGTVVVGEIGSKEKKEYTVMGDVVNLTSRLKDIAHMGDIVVSEPVFRASRYLFEYEASPPVAVKGLEDPIRVFKPLRQKERPDPKRGISGLRSPLVGREHERADLREAVDRLNTGRGGVFFVLGDAGIGKTRLIEELREPPGIPQSAARALFYLDGRCLPLTETTPYAPFLQILGDLYELTESDSRETVQGKILARSKELSPTGWAEIVPYVGYLLSAGFTGEIDEKVRYLDPKALKLQIFAGVNKLLAVLSRARPLVLVIENYHWIDQESLDLLEFIFAREGMREALPILLVGLTRIEKEKPGHRTKEHLRTKLGDDFREIVLRPLDRESGTQLVENLLALPGFPQEFKSKIVARAEGNPFYMEEIVRSLIESGVLVFREGAWSLGAKPAALKGIRIPDTVHAVITSRLDRLEPDLKDVLLNAAVLGRSFYVPVLEQLCKIDSMILTVHLATLEDYEFISEKKKKVEPEYVFRHPLLQEVVYDSILRKKRQELHRRAAAAIEQTYRGRLDDFAELLAYQYARSDDHDKAIEWLMRSGQKAKNRFANDEALRYFEEIVATIEDGYPAESAARRLMSDRLGAAHEAAGDIQSLRGAYDPAMKHYRAMEKEGQDNVLTQLKAKRRMAEVRQRRGDYDQALSILGEAEQLAETGSGAIMIERAESFILKSLAYNSRGLGEEAIREVEAGLKILDNLSVSDQTERDLLEQARAKGYNGLGLIFYQRGDAEKAIGVFRKFLNISQGTRNKRAIAAANHNMGLAYLAQGDYDHALSKLEESLRIFDEIGDRLASGNNLSSIGNIHSIRGDFEKAISLYERFLARSEEIGYQRGISMSYLNLGSAYKEMGEYEKAFDYTRKKLEMSEAVGDLHGSGFAACNLGELYLIKGDRGMAAEHLLRAEGLFKKTKEKQALTRVYEYLAELHWQTGRLTEAADYAGQALALAEESAARSEMGRCYVVQGKIHIANGDLRKGDEYFHMAIELFGQLRLRKQLAEAYLEYAKIIKINAGQGGYGPKMAREYATKARAIYDELQLGNLVKEVDCFEQALGAGDR